MLRGGEMARPDLLELSITCGAFLVALSLIFLACSLGAGALNALSVVSGASGASAEIVGDSGSDTGIAQKGGVTRTAGPQTSTPLLSSLQGIREATSCAVAKGGELLNTSFGVLFIVLIACFMLSMLYSMSRPPEEGGWA
jgi:hypothetical protein